jgi:predicted acyltransferase
MPIDLGQVDWLYVGVLAVFAFVATFLANLLSFNRRGLAAVLAAALFAAFFIFWTYYPHGAPFLPISIAGQKTPTSAVVPPVATVPPKPSNPVTDITPSPNAPR